MSKSNYFVYVVENTATGRKYNYIGNIEVNDGESAKKIAKEKYFKGQQFLPTIRVSTCPLGDHAKSYLPSFFK